MENMVLKVLDFDLTVYHIYTPLMSLMDESNQAFEREILNLAYKTFYN